MAVGEQNSLEESAGIFKTKYFQMCSVFFEKRVFTKIFPFLIGLISDL